MKNKPNCLHTADLDSDQSSIESQANSRHELDMTNLNNVRTTTAPTTTTTTTQAATASKVKNCRSLIQKRAHTLDDFMEGKRNCRLWIKRQSYCSVVKWMHFVFGSQHHTKFMLWLYCDVGVWGERIVWIMEQFAWHLMHHFWQGSLWV